MSLNRKRFRLRHLLALVAVLGVLAAGCGNSSSSSSTTSTTKAGDSGDKVSVTAPGVSDSEIKFAAIGTNSNNPLGTCVLDCYVQGIKSYFDWRNSEGGVDGRKLVLSEQLDDELSKNQEKALEVISANDVFGVFNAPQVPSGWADLEQAGIPNYVWGIHSVDESGKMQTFPNLAPICATCTTRQPPYVAQQVGAKKVATLGYGVSQNSKDCANAAADSIKQYSSDVGGAEVVYKNDSIEFGMTNGIGPEVTAMKNAGVDLVLACIDLNGMKTLAQEFDRQGYADKVTLFHTNTYDQNFVKDAGSLFDNDYVQVQFRPFEADAGDSSLAQFKQYMEQNGYPITELAMVGWINADTAYTGLKAAGAQFDRKAVIDATNKITDYTAGGLMQPIDWSRQHVAPTEADPTSNAPIKDCMAFVKVENSAFVVVGDPAKPWVCWPGDTRAWSVPVATDFQ
jgi:ABC-type branched-subunit amino acid transport system substrate-binding protein